MREHWRQVRGYRRQYMVSDRGRVMSIHFGRNKILKLSINRCGQEVVCLSCYGRTETRAVHLLVREAFGK